MTAETSDEVFHPNPAHPTTQCGDTGGLAPVCPHLPPRSREHTHLEGFHLVFRTLLRRNSNVFYTWPCHWLFSLSSKPQPHFAVPLLEILRGLGKCFPRFGRPTWARLLWPRSRGLVSWMMCSHYPCLLGNQRACWEVRVSTFLCTALCLRSYPQVTFCFVLFCFKRPTF